MGLAGGVMSLHNFVAMFTTKQCRSLEGAYKKFLVSHQPISAFLWRARLQRNFTRSGILFSPNSVIWKNLFHLRNSIRGQACDFERRKTFTDNICDELRKRRSSLKINPDDQISMWIHHGLRFLFVCKFISQARSKNIWRSLNLEVNCDVHFASKKRRATKTRSVEQQTEQTFVNHDVIELNRERDAFTRRFMFENCCTWTSRSWSHWFMICVHARRSFELSREKSRRK